MLYEDYETRAQEWSVGLPDYMSGDLLLSKDAANYGDYQAYFDAFREDWIKDATEVTGVDAEAFFAKVKDMYAKKMVSLQDGGSQE